MAEQKKNSSKYTNLEPNIAAALSYLLMPISGLAIFIIEKDDKYVRFHAFQSLLTGAGLFLFWSILSTLFIYSTWYFFWRLYQVAWLLLVGFLMWKAYNNEKFELPVVGKMANKQIDKK